MSKNLQTIFDEQKSLGNKQSYRLSPNLGKKFSDEHRANISAAHSRRAPVSTETRAKMSAARQGKKTGKPVTTPLGSFANSTEAAEAQGCSKSMIQWYLRERPELYFYTGSR